MQRICPRPADLSRFLYKSRRHQRHNGHFQKSIYIIFERSAGDKAEWSAENRASLPAKLFYGFFQQCSRGSSDSGRRAWRRSLRMGRH